MHAHVLLAMKHPRRGKLHHCCISAAMHHTLYGRGASIANLMQVKNVLHSSEGKDKVLQTDGEAKQELNKRGVPHFLDGAADRQECISLHGAQSTTAPATTVQQATEA